ncbi:MAG: type II toxin-antitoxin system RelE family toxin [Solirubrobacteraceae bacterium]
MADEPQPEYELILTPPARRAIAERMPEAVAAAVINFITTSLIRAPRRVGKPLRGDLAGIWSARRGSYRVLYRLHENPREVIVLRVEHRVMCTGRFEVGAGPRPRALAHYEEAVS